MNTLTLRIGFSLTVVALALSLAACGKKDTKPAATQVASRVDSDEITVHDINQALQRSNTAGLSPEAAKNLGADILEKLIDQQLAVSRATAADLHRSAEVFALIEASRRDILARAYMQNLTATLPKPSAADVKKYYAKNPQLFSERHIYNIQEIIVPKNADDTHANTLRGYVSAGRSMDEAAAALKQAGIAFNGGSATRAAEEIPLDMLKQLSGLKEGQSIVFETPQGATLMRVVASQRTPVTEADALPRIEQFLTNLRANETVAADIKRLRASTKITYMGEFAKAGGNATGQGENQHLSPLAAAQSAIERGVAWLK